MPSSVRSSPSRDQGHESAGSPHPLSFAASSAFCHQAVPPIAPSGVRSEYDFLRRKSGVPTHLSHRVHLLALLSWTSHDKPKVCVSYKPTHLSHICSNHQIVTLFTLLRFTCHNCYNLFTITRISFFFFEITLARPAQTTLAQSKRGPGRKMLNSGLPQLRSAQAGCFGSSPARAPDVLRLPASPQPVAALATRRRRRASLPPPAPFLSQAMSRAQHGSNEASGCYGVGARLPARHLRRGLARRAAAAAQQADGHRRGHGPRLRQCSFFFYTRFFYIVVFFLRNRKPFRFHLNKTASSPPKISKLSDLFASSPSCQKPHPTILTRRSVPRRSSTITSGSPSPSARETVITLVSQDLVYPSTVFILRLCLSFF